MNEITPEQQKDIDTRVAEFLKRHGDNVKELEVDFAMIPVPVQVMPSVYAMQVKAMPIDSKYAAKPSPFANDEKVIKA